MNQQIFSKLHKIRRVRYGQVGLSDRSTKPMWVLFVNLFYHIVEALNYLTAQGFKDNYYPLAQQSFWLVLLSILWSVCHTRVWFYVKVKI